jgi:mono/diheme cytochrome c family protein
MLRSLGAWLAALALAACGEDSSSWALRPLGEALRFPARDAAGAIVAEGALVGARELNWGRMLYVSYCARCHGFDGDGRGPDAAGLDPPPRDLRLGAYKFAAVRAGELPNDDDLVRALGYGFRETAMTGWRLPADDLGALAHFVKTFPRPDGRPSRWLDTYASGPHRGQPRPTGEPVRTTTDPWGAEHAEAAVAAGRAIYHLEAQCDACHPSHLSDEERAALARERGLAPGEAGAGAPRTRASEPIVMEAARNPYGIDVAVPDLRTRPARSARSETELADLYLVIAAGVGGLMPAWVDGLSHDRIWALAYYVRSLAPPRR